MRSPWLPVTISAVLTLGLFSACGSEADQGGAVWGGTIDTLASGRIVVTNPAEGMWAEGEAWTVTEDLRIGSFDDPGAYSFGQIIALDVDDYGRIWVLESQAAEVRVFDADGRHVRTTGGKGGGPGEFAGPAHLQLGPDGDVWVPDPQNGRINVIDTTGVFVEEHRMAGGFFFSPWPGGFDHEGRYYLPVPMMIDGEFALSTVVFDADMSPVDTLKSLANPDPPERFELVSPDGEGRLVATVPFSAGLSTTRSPAGTQWGMMTGDYLLFEVDAAGDTLRVIHAEYEPIRVTEADREVAIEGLSWFTDQGGKLDAGLLPDMKPAAWNLFVDDAGRIWVSRMTQNPAGQDYDLFDPDGRFLGRVQLPVPMNAVRRVVGDHIYGVTQDELGVPYVIRARIEMHPSP